MKSKHTIRSIILFFLVLIEVLSATHWQQSMSMQWCRWLHIISGIGVVVILCFKIPRENHMNIKTYRWIPFLLWIVLGLRLLPGFNTMFSQHPLDYTHADMLPVIEVMVKRWISFEPVYELIPQFWNGVMPVYLPALWLPFVPAVLFSFDLRWITVGILFLVLLYVLVRKKSNPWSWVIFIPIGLWFNYLQHNRTETFILSEEGVVYAYYMLLVVAIYTRHFISVGISLTLCLLSRYGIAFFAIGLALSMYWMISRKNWLYLIGGMSASGIVLMTITGAWSKLHIFFNLPSAYLKNIADFKSKYQNELNDGLGVVPMIDLDYMPVVYRLMVILLIIVAILMIINVKRFDHRFYFLAFLKLSLVIFYNMLIIPYQYLFFTSIWVSIAICFVYMNHFEKIEIELS